MNLNNLTDITFVSSDKEQVVKYLLDTYKAVTGRTLAKSDPVRLFVLVIASVIIMLLNKINYVGKQNLLKYAVGDNLDHIGALVGVARQQPKKAQTILRFTLSAARDSAVIVPAGTRVSNGSQVYFATTAQLTILAGAITGDVRAVCMVVGEAGNNYDVGELNAIVDQIPYVKSVTNITVSDGGATLEDDDSFRDRIQHAPESFSCAGAAGAYEFFAKKASTIIEDVKVVSPAPGEVVIYPLLKDGQLPGDEILNDVLTICNDKSVRPLTDHLSAKAPNEIKYDIDITYYINSSDSALTSVIQADIDAAISAYIVWQRSVMGRDINPSELTKLVMNAGAKRVTINAPTRAPVKNGSKEDNYEVEIAVINSKTVTYGGLEDE